jgi:hypothetical protein
MSNILNITMDTLYSLCLNIESLSLNPYASNSYM